MVSEDKVALDRALRRFGWAVTDSGCWEWSASRTNLRGGYGQVRVGKKLWKAHRAAYAAWVGPLQPGLYVCHKCDNPPCINPDHLFQGTAAENNQDKARKGRAAFPVLPGEMSPNAKLTWAQVREIRRRLAEGESGAALGREFGTTKENVWRIKTQKAWKESA